MKIRCNQHKKGYFSFETFCTHLSNHIKKSRADRALKASALGQPRRMRWGGRWEGGLRREDTYIPVADSWQHMVKTTTVL